MRLVKGISRAQVEGIERSRQEGRFVSVEDLVRRSGTSPGTLARLAAADAFGSMGLNRREALWAVLGGWTDHDENLPLFAGLKVEEARPALPDQSLSERVAQDYETAGMSLAAHPISLLRERLRQMGIIDARELRRTRAGVRVKVAGLVLVRQRPATASGTLFYTLEDETGTVNLIVRPKVYEQWGRATRRSVALVAEGRVERQGEVIHLLAERLGDLGERLKQERPAGTQAVTNLRVRSRDFC